MYAYIHIYIYIYTHMYTHTYISLSLSVYMYIYIYRERERDMSRQCSWFANFALKPWSLVRRVLQLRDRRRALARRDLAAPELSLSCLCFNLLDLCVSSLCRGHANLLCIVPMLTDDPRRESVVELIMLGSCLTCVIISWLVCIDCFVSFRFLCVYCLYRMVCLSCSTLPGGP